MAHRRAANGPAGGASPSGPSQDEIWSRARGRPRRSGRPSADADVLHLRLTAIALGVATVVVLGTVGFALWPTNSDFGVVHVRLTVSNGAAAFPTDPAFWGINQGANVPISPALTSAVDGTPARSVRFPGGAAGDALNYSSGLLTNSSGATYPAQVNVSSFVGWCRALGCHALLELPGEIADPSTAAYYVAYTENVLKFRPVAWEVGNEPALWTHFAIPWARWTATQAVTPTPGQYALLVHEYIAAIHRVDPAAPVLGLPGVGTGAYLETNWINATVAINGLNLSGVAIHAYPAGSGTGPSVDAAAFFENVSGPRSLGARVLADRAAIAANLPAGASLPLIVSEMGTGIVGGGFTPWIYGYAAAPFVASEIIDALTLNVSRTYLAQVQTPHGGYWLDGNATYHPLYDLYSTLVPQLGPWVQPVSITPSLPGLSAVLTVSRPGGSPSLLVDNANVSYPVALDLSGSGLPVGSAAVAWTWDPTTPTPVAHSEPSASASWTIPTTGLLLLNFSGPIGTPAVLPVTSPGTAGPTLADRSVVVGPDTVRAEVRRAG